MSSILFVDQSGQLGGAELCLADIAEGYRDHAEVLLLSPGPFAEFLRKRGIATSVHALPPALAEITKSASVSTLAAAMPAGAAYLLRLRRKLKRFDLVYLNTAKALLFGVASSALSGKKRVFHLHDILDRQHFSGANIRLLIGAANQTDAVIANSEATAAAFREAGGRASTHVVPNGFDPEIFSQVDQQKVAALRREFDPEGRPIIAIFGRLTRWKGQHILLEAARQLPEARFWLVGEALFTDDDRAYADELRARAEQPGSNVSMLGFRDDVPELMHAADVVAHCSIAAEPFGRVLVEAMLSGKPVVAAAAGGPKEIVEDRVTGFLTPPGDVLALTNALRALIESSPRRAEMGAAGLERATRLFSLPVVREKTDRVLQSLLTR